MSSIAEEDEVVQRVLESFQRELQGCAARISRVLLGGPPSEGFARRLSQADGEGRMTGSVRGVWRITLTEISAIAPSFAIPQARRTRGMYYDLASFDFAVAGDNESVVVGLGFGPRFGRGYRYRVIVDDDGRANLKLAEGLWKS